VFWREKKTRCGRGDADAAAASKAFVDGVLLFLVLLPLLDTSRSLDTESSQRSWLFTLCRLLWTGLRDATDADDVVHVELAKDGRCRPVARKQRPADR